MSATVEQKLRARIDLLRDQRDELEQQRDRLAGRVVRLERRLGYQFTHCRYCGRPTEARDGACNAHADLPRLDADF